LAPDVDGAYSSSSTISSSEQLIQKQIQLQRQQQLEQLNREYMQMHGQQHQQQHQHSSQYQSHEAGDHKKKYAKEAWPGRKPPGHHAPVFTSFSGESKEAIGVTSPIKTLMTTSASSPNNVPGTKQNNIPAASGTSTSKRLII
jgi:hypothetical protein